MDREPGGNLSKRFGSYWRADSHLPTNFAQPVVVSFAHIDDIQVVKDGRQPHKQPLALFLFFLLLRIAVQNVACVLGKKGIVKILGVLFLDLS